MHQAVSVANEYPRRSYSSAARPTSQDEAKARELDAKVSDLHKFLFIESSPIPAKWALQQMSMIGAGIRLPLTPLDAQYYGAVADAMKKAGVG